MRHSESRWCSSNQRELAMLNRFSPKFKVRSTQHTTANVSSRSRGEFPHHALPVLRSPKTHAEKADAAMG